MTHDLHLKRYCSAIFLDITKALDKVWRMGLLQSIKRNLSLHMRGEGFTEYAFTPYSN